MDQDCPWCTVIVYWTEKWCSCDFTFTLYRNPTPGKIINRPDGDDVYHGVPKDYSGLTVSNFQLVHQLIYMYLTY